MSSAPHKTAIVTGANTGLGFETSLGLAKAGYHVVLACRTQARADEAMDKIRRKSPDAQLEFIQIDLIDRDSIRAFATAFSERHETLDLLVNNAGVMGPPYTITQNELELQFDANHVGHFYLTHLLFEKLDQSFETRIVNVSSLAGKWEGAEIKFDNLNFEGIYDQGREFMGLKGMDAYSQSKLANILFTTELRDRLASSGKNIKALVVHPGASNTDLSRNMSASIRFFAPILVKFMNVSTPAEGARPTLMAALDDNVNSGDFFGPTGKEERTGPPGKVDLPPQAYDKATAERLWALTEELLSIKFEI